MVKPQGGEAISVSDLKSSYVVRSVQALASTRPDMPSDRQTVQNTHLSADTGEKATIRHFRDRVRVSTLAYVHPHF